MLERRIKATNEALARFVDRLPPVRTEISKAVSPTAKQELLLSEIKRELTMRELKNEIDLCIHLLEKGPIAGGKMEFSASTGALDGMPYLSAGFSAATGLTTLGAAIPVIVAGHHMLVHGLMETLHMHGFFMRVAAEIMAAPGIIGIATIAIAAGAVAGPLIWGGVKTLAGSVNRKTTSGAAAFEEQAIASQKLQSSIYKCCNTALEGLSDVMSVFYARNQILRQSVAQASWQQVQTLKKGGGELHKLQSELGSNEEIDEWRMVVAQGQYFGLRSQDIRSPALKAAYEKTHCAVPNAEETKDQPTGVVPRLIAAGRFVSSIFTVGLQSSLSSVISFVQNANSAGANAAMDFSHEIDDWCNANRGLIATGMGSAIAHTYHIALKSRDPVDATRDAFEMVVSALNLKREWRKGATIGEILWTGLDLKDISYLLNPTKDDLTLTPKEKRQRLLFFTCKLPVKLAILLFKKPLIGKEVKLNHLLEGDPTPSIIIDEVTKSQGRMESVKSGAREILDQLKGTMHFLFVKLPIHLPLKIGANQQSQETKLGKIIPFDCFNKLQSTYARRQLKIINRKHGINDYEEKLLKDGHNLRSMNLDEIKVFVINEKNAFRKGDSSYTYSEMKTLLRYWQLRIAKDWFGDMLRSFDHSKDLASMDPRLLNLRIAARDEGVWKKLQSARNLRIVFSNYDELKKLQKDFEEKPCVRPTQSEPHRPVVLDIMKNGKFLVLTPEGHIKQINEENIYRSLAYRHANEPTKQYVLLPHADESRIGLAASVLGKLEPHQREALITAHYMSLKSTGGFKEQIIHLLKNEYSASQLLGSSDGIFPGIFRLGIVGDNIPSEDQIREAIRVLNLEL